VAYPNVTRIDPDTGDSETIYRADDGYSVHTVEFNLDSTVLYLATIGAGDVYALALDADLNPVGDPEVYARDVGTSYHDGIGIDVCGYLYVAEYYSHSLYRIAPDGTVMTYVDPDSTTYGHGVRFGHGVGGWRTDAIYQPEPYNNNAVREVIVGVPGGDAVRTWNGEPAPW
jgi:hypothetical protein